MFNLFGAGYFGRENDRSVFLRFNLLAMMPDFFFDVTRHFLIESDFHFDWFVVDDLEGALHVGFQVKVAGDLESVVCYVHHLYAVQHEHADFVSQVAKADEVEGGVEEHDLVAEKGTPLTF